MVASRAQLERIHRRTTDVSITTPAINGAEAETLTFRLRQMSGTERDAFEAGTFVDEVIKAPDGTVSIDRKINSRGLRARLVALCLVDDKGARFYADDEVEQLSANVPSDVLSTLFVEAQKLNGLDAKAVETAEKN